MKTIIILFFTNLCILNAQVVKNDLANETSPYLLQHATNPVHWMPWGKKAFVRAKEKHKPIFLSIGYSTCHWCHVMEKESFANKKIAKLLNKYFISVKVDREEMPQLDALYQNIYKKVHNHSGGWPLSVFMTPKKEVFYITTYIPLQKESYSEGLNTLLPKLGTLHKNKKELKKAIIKESHAMRLNDKRVDIDEISADYFTQTLKKDYDTIYTGFGRGKKFPQAAKLSLMMDLAQIREDKELEKDYFATLDTMVLRGLYDHVGGGFFRYSVDAAWEIPHFEKMLYNQAELIPLYARAYALSHKKIYKNVVNETVNMVEKRFAKDDFYFSASDADSDGKEGEFFTYTRQEIQKSLENNPYKKEIEDAMEFSFYGNFKNKVHINFYTKRRPKGFEAFKKELLKIRKDRKYPFIDKKINTAWNAMMIEALYKASFIDEKYAKIADKHLKALKNLMFINGELYHQTIFNHTPKQKGLLEDYAFFIAALLSAYENDYNEKKLLFAEYLLTHAKEKFYKNKIWYLSDDDMHIKADVNDKYYTSAVSQMIENVVKISAIKASFRYKKFANESLNTLKSQLKTKASNAPALAKDYLMNHFGVVVLKSSQSNLIKNMQVIQSIKYPYVVTKQKEQNDFLACTLRRCFSKDKSLKKVIFRINSFLK